MYITRLASKEIFSPSNKIYREVGQAKDLTAPLYIYQEGNKLQRQKILSFIYAIYNHNWMKISTIYMYITRLASNEIFSPSHKIYREVGQAKGLTAPLYIYRGAVKSLARPGRKQATAIEDFEFHISYL